MFNLQLEWNWQIVSSCLITMFEKFTKMNYTNHSIAKACYHFHQKKGGFFPPSHTGSPEYCRKRTHTGPSQHIVTHRQTDCPRGKTRLCPVVGSPGLFSAGSAQTLWQYLLPRELNTGAKLHKMIMLCNSLRFNFTKYSGLKNNIKTLIVSCFAKEIT
jgi:hypothetical protein